MILRQEKTMTARDIENDMKKCVNGASFITPSQLASWLGQKNITRIREKYMGDAFRIEGTNKYFIPEVAKTVFYLGTNN